MIALLLLGLVGSARVGADEIAFSWFAQRNVSPPAGDRLTVCHGFGCTYQAPIHFASHDLVTLAHLMAPGAASPAEERNAIREVEAWFERRLIAELGGHARHSGFYPAGSEVAGEMDCLDLSTNTTALLLVLEQHGLLRHHDIKRPEARGIFIYGAHATAVVLDKETGTEWAIDPWQTAAGAPPDVMPLAQWFAETGSPHIITQKTPMPEHRRHAKRLRGHVPATHG